MSDDSPFEYAGELKYVHFSEIEPNINNPREAISEASVLELMESIEEVKGILVPLVVYRRSENDYLLIDGERRLLASIELAKKEERYAYVPVNIIDKALSDEEMVQYMFNIHMERKQWSAGAIGEAIGKIREAGARVTNRELAKKYHVSESVIANAIKFYSMPEVLKKRSLEGEINEYYLIYIAGSLNAIETVYPEIIEKYGREDLAIRLYEKNEKGYVDRTRDFELIGKTVRKCVKYNEKEIYREKFVRMIEDISYTPRQADLDTFYELGAKIEMIFISNCEEFIKSVKGVKNNQEKTGTLIGEKVKEILKELYDEIEEIL